MAVVAERDDEPAKPAPAGTVGKGSSAPSGPPPAAQPEPNAQRGPSPQIPKLPLNPDGTIKGGNEALMTALLSKNAGIFFGDEHGTIEVVDTFSRLLPTLKASGVRVLFVEMASPSILEKFQKDGDTKALKAHLVGLGWDFWDRGADKKWVDHLVNMLATARKNGIKLCGIGDSDSAKFPKINRIAKANRDWALAIPATLATQPKNEKYVIFGGDVHSGNQSGKEGINVLLGVPSITPSTATHWPPLPMTMATGAVAQNPNPNQSDFIWKAQ